MKQDSPKTFSSMPGCCRLAECGEVKSFIYDYEPDKYYMARRKGIIDFDRLMNKIGSSR